MLQLFVENLKRLSVFIIVSQTILHFGVGRKFEKYLKLVFSFMVVAQLVFSIGAYFDFEHGIWEFISQDNYEQRLEEYMGRLEQEFEVQQSELESRLQQTPEVENKNNKGEANGIRVDRIRIP